MKIRTSDRLTVIAREVAQLEYELDNNKITKEEFDKQYKKLFYPKKSNHINDSEVINKFREMFKN
jgi:DNA-directed RNA polymerase